MCHYDDFDPQKFLTLFLGNVVNYCILTFKIFHLNLKCNYVAGGYNIRRTNSEFPDTKVVNSCKVKCFLVNL